MWELYALLKAGIPYPLPNNPVVICNHMFKNLPAPIWFEALDRMYGKRPPMQIGADMVAYVLKGFNRNGFIPFALSQKAIDHDTK